MIDNQSQGLPATAFLPISPEEVPDPFNSPDGRNLQRDLDGFGDSGCRHPAVGQADSQRILR